MALPPGFGIDTDPVRLDRDMIHRFLSEESYWARGIPRAVVDRAIAGSLCFGIYAPDGRQAGFGRAVTDRATFAYVSDVFVLPEFRGHGLSRALMHAMQSHPELQGLRRWLLVTRDAHGLYAGCGFTALPNPERFMTAHRPDAYAAP